MQALVLGLLKALDGLSSSLVLSLSFYLNKKKVHKQACEVKVRKSSMSMHSSTSLYPLKKTLCFCVRVCGFFATKEENQLHIA